MALPAVAEPGGRRRLELLDVLRFVAALMVVGFHWLFNGIYNGKVTSLTHGPLADVAAYGYFGVHLFFIISGYVISTSARGRTAGRFAAGRAERLFPAYWVGMTVTSLVAIGWGATVMDRVGWRQFLANLTMAPGLFGQKPIDGVYWTLTVELSFYVLVFGLLFLGLGRFLERFFPLWAVGMLLVMLVAPQHADLPYAGGYYALFAGGAIMATIRRRGFHWYQLVGLAAAGIVVARFVARQTTSFNLQRGTELSQIGVVALVAVFFALVALMWIPRVADLRVPFSRQISDLTYPVYLLHAHLGYMALQAFADDRNAAIVYPLLFLALLASAWLLHRVVEVGMKTIWRSFFGTVLERPVTWLRRRTRLDRFDRSDGSAVTAPGETPPPRATPPAVPRS